MSDGAASGSWTTLGLSSLASTAKAFEAQLFHVRDEKTSGTSGGTFTTGAWRTRTLNTSVTNEITSASLGSNQITLPTGTYRIMASAPGIAVNEHKAKLYNVTDASDTILGTSEYASGSANITSRSYVNGTFTIVGAKVFELRHRGGSTDSSGFGVASSFGTEVYAEVLIWKIA